ncbi:MAG: type VI secretion system tube protein TssD [Terracidiphilus sp.]
MRIVHPGRLLVLCGVIAALLTAMPAMAAVNAYMTVKGVKQGSIKGDQMSDSIKLISVVRDTPSGMSTGRRTYSTITITKEIDEASPGLAMAASSHETLSEVVITFEGGSGGAKTAQMIVLTNATILSVRKSGRTEEISFHYRGIGVTYAKGGISATDDWEVPN